MYDSDELRALAVAAQGRAMVEAVLEMSPETVLELLDEIERLRKDAHRWKQHIAMMHNMHSATAVRETIAVIDASINAARTQGDDA